MDSLQFLDEVWSKQLPGFVCISIKRTDGSWEDILFDFKEDDPPEELYDVEEGDIYFCPNVFSRPHRRLEYFIPSCWLYADLDLVVPIENDAELSPTIAIESSPGRYQGLWHIDKFLTRDGHGRINKQLTYTLGADKGGWGCTKVLRVPDTINHKYEEKPEVKLLWH